MRKAVRVVVLAVTLVQSSAVAGNELVLTDARIAECRAMLKLSAGQEQYWAPIEATLRDIARRANARGRLSMTRAGSDCSPWRCHYSRRWDPNRSAH
jgi:hypothetical protein